MNSEILGEEEQEKLRFWLVEGILFYLARKSDGKKLVHLSKNTPNAKEAQRERGRKKAVFINIRLILEALKSRKGVVVPRADLLKGRERGLCRTSVWKLHRGGWGRVKAGQSKGGARYGGKIVEGKYSRGKNLLLPGRRREPLSCMTAKPRERIGGKEKDILGEEEIDLTWATNTIVAKTENVW